MNRLVLFATILMTWKCHGFVIRSLECSRHHSGRPGNASPASSPHSQNDDDDTVIYLDELSEIQSNQGGPSFTAACQYSETFGPDKERLTVDGQRIWYRNGRVVDGKWVGSQGRPEPHLYNVTLFSSRASSNVETPCDVVIDKNGFPWRAEHVLSENGLRRNNMEATRQLWRSLDETELVQNVSLNAESTDIQMPIPWHGPFNLPPQERGIGSNRKLRDEHYGFGCELDDERWLVYYTKLAAFMARFGHVDVPLEWKEDESLGRWVFKQRMLYRRYVRNNYYQHEVISDRKFGRKLNPLSPWRIQMLYDIGFSFKINLRWKDRYEQLRKFKEKHGHVRVSSSNATTDREFPGLALWIQSQRTEYRKLRQEMPTSMTQPRVLALDALGLDWDPVTSQWESRIQDLKQFREQHGNLRVKKAQDFELATWLIYQRSQYRIYQDRPWDSTLTSQKIHDLDELGVEWDPLESRWQSQFRALKAFREVHGTCAVPVDYPDDRSLSLWVQKQRKSYRDGKLPKVREEQLRDIGFVFDIYGDVFSRGLEKLTAYRMKFGHCRVPRSSSDTEVVSFVIQQRNQYRQLQNGQESSLTAERIERLEGLGFQWSVRTRTPAAKSRASELKELRMLAPTAKLKLADKNGDVAKLLKKEICSILFVDFGTEIASAKHKKGELVALLQEMARSKESTNNMAVTGSRLCK